MSQEQAPKRKKLLPQGLRIFKIVKVSKEVKSKKGNNQYIITLRDLETDYEEDDYFVSESGKRWKLKMLLDACGVEKDAEGKYLFPDTPILDIDILGLVEHEPNEFINRNGETIKTTQHKIVDFKKYEPTNINGKPVTDPSQIQWKD